MRELLDCCPECGKAAQIEDESGAGQGAADEVISNVQMSLEQMKSLANKVAQERARQVNQIKDLLEEGEVGDLIRQTIQQLTEMALDEVVDDNRQYEHPNRDFLTARNDLLGQIKRLQNLLEAEYIDNQRSGRPVVRKWISATGPKQQIEVFRKHLPEEVDETGIEVVGLLDQSGSMGSMMDHASQATWAIASAVRLSNNQCTMVGFDHDAYLLIGRKQRLSDKMYPVFGARGGTDPYDALKIAENIFSTTDMPNRLLYIVTDGEWSDEHRSAQFIKRIKADHDVDSILVCIGNMRKTNNTRGCDHMVFANDPKTMCDEISKVIIDISQKAAVRIAAQTHREV